MDNKQKELKQRLEVVYGETLERVADCTKSADEAKLEMARLAELAKQMQAMTDAERVESEAAAHSRELDMKQQQIEGEKHGRIINAVLGAAGVVTSIGSMIFAHTWMKRGMRFEETGTYTSKTSKAISDTTRLFK